MENFQHTFELVSKNSFKLFLLECDYLVKYFINSIFKESTELAMTSNTKM